jgi:hypothetical protein
MGLRQKKSQKSWMNRAERWLSPEMKNLLPDVEEC